MKEAIKILIIEDELLIAANTSMHLSSLGYSISGIFSNAEEALKSVSSTRPDIALLDIQLKGKMDGIEIAQILHDQFGIPIIYLTANADDMNFNRAKSTNPFAFISKPFRKLDLQRAIELTLNQIQQKDTIEETLVNTPIILNDRIFVRNSDKMIKIFIKDILYIEADRNYCRIFSKDKQFVQVITLKEMEAKLPKVHFLRIHRSFIVNLDHLNEVAGSYVVIANKTIPLSKTVRGELLERLQTF
ncbi:response regulator [Gramella sp. AN32]|uniref:LytR/AlgR family response regulator transcription factor n=1 Tax=Christiangramia antarctica TaxID=2058158 RepID=A0ABW5X949_9FLAO|nr:response regulator [Gramella sp. AN32]MCM4158176.1 DNA-binding response regulator [Gramella sp. AN32]